MTVSIPVPLIGSENSPDEDAGGSVVGGGVEPVPDPLVAVPLKNTSDCTVRLEGDTPASVVLARGQFEPWSTRARELKAIKPESARYQKVAAVVLGLVLVDHDAEHQA